MSSISLLWLQLSYNKKQVSTLTEQLIETKINISRVYQDICDCDKHNTMYLLALAAGKRIYIAELLSYRKQLRQLGTLQKAIKKSIRILQSVEDMNNWKTNRIAQ